jgi:hypothetical protein
VACSAPMFSGSKQRGADARRANVGTNTEVPQDGDIRTAFQYVDSWCVERDHGAPDSLPRTTRRDQPPMRGVEPLQPSFRTLSLDRVVVLDPRWLDRDLLQMDSSETGLGDRHREDPLNLECDRNPGMLDQTLDRLLLDMDIHKSYVRIHERGRVTLEVADMWPAAARTRLIAHPPSSSASLAIRAPCAPCASWLSTPSRRVRRVGWSAACPRKLQLPKASRRLCL